MPAWKTAVCPPRLLCRLLRRPLLLCLAGWLWVAAAAWAGPALQLPADATGLLDAWPSISMLSDPDGSLDAEGALRRRAEFQPPTGPHANLGQRRDVVWLLLPLHTVGGDGHWVLNIDFPPLNHIDVLLLRDGKPVARHMLGRAVDTDQRPMRSRAHAVALQLAPDTPHLLLLRVATQSAMLLPITLAKPADHHAREADIQLLQGLLIGVTLALLVYSLAHWLSLREPMFLGYALVLSGITAFFVSYVGIGQQHLWTQHSGVLSKLAPLGVLVALVGGSMLSASTLQTRRLAPRTHRGLVLVSAAATVVFLAAVAGALDYRQTQTLVTLLSPMPLLLAIPVAWRQARGGDAMAVYMLLGWVSYMVGALCMLALLRGLLPVNFWTQHLFQFSTLLEMLIWTRVLGLRIADVRHHAERAALEHAALVALAHTDPLTGLPNRRGLQTALDAALPHCRGHSALAVFLLDLDGFKPINDRLGHDAGDTLLVQVGQRLRQQVRQGDLVARLGGDEFVIMAPGIPSEAEAMVLGRKLLDAFNRHFTVGGDVCRVGLTIGFALAPHDGSNADDLLKRADAAMYAGKQAGRHTVRRGGASVGLAG